MTEETAYDIAVKMIANPFGCNKIRFDDFGASVCLCESFFERSLKINDKPYRSLENKSFCKLLKDCIGNKLSSYDWNKGMTDIIYMPKTLEELLMKYDLEKDIH